MDFMEMYAQKKMTAEQAASLVKSGDWVDYGWGGNTPPARGAPPSPRQYGELPLGYDHKYVYSHFGYNLKATDLQASIGCAQLDKFPGFVERRRPTLTG